MCGIVGYIGQQSLLDILLQGLKRLEYRGYDSSGAAWIEPGEALRVVRAVGEVRHLESKVSETDCYAGAGIAHTRWATHGSPTEENAHPHTDQSGKIAIVHNGIVENHDALRETMLSHGVRFTSETDSEVVAQLIGYYYSHNHGFEESVRKTVQKIEGAFGLAVLCLDEPDKLIAARRGSSMIIGIGAAEHIIASDMAAIVQHTSRVVHLDDNEIAVFADGGFHTSTFDRQHVDKEIEVVDMEVQEMELGHFEHYMLKEIHEQPRCLHDTLSGRIDLRNGRARIAGLEELHREIAKVRQIVMLGCGTAWHAGMIGQYLIEELARIPCDIQYSSEFRYRNPLVREGTLAIVVSQSGETADTLAAMEEVRLRGATCFGIINTVGSRISRETDAGVYLRAGQEVGVASTKAFTAQVALLAVLAAELGRRRHLSMDRCASFLEELHVIPEKLERILGKASAIRELTSRFVDHDHWLYLGRGVNFPVALEGALKLKEISYIHAEGMPAAEMKHGPIALIEPGMPVVFVAPRDHLHQKVLANIQEVTGRGGEVIAICTEGDRRMRELTDHIIEIPETEPMLSPILSVVPLQLMAYEAALLRGHNVDKPRNLAKSVTVE